MKENAERWLHFAHEDLASAKSVFRDGIHNQVCFHSQQCCEKALKAMIVTDGKVPPRTHSIKDLADLASFKSEKLSGEDLQTFDDYYIPTRYPDAVPGAGVEGLPKEEDSRELIKMAETVLFEIKKIL